MNIHKRGQGLTLYIILGIIILVIFIFLTYFMNKIELKPMKVEVQDGDALKGFINSCIGEIGSNALFILGRQGGYVTELPSTHHVEPYGSMGFAFYDGQNIFISTDEMKVQFDSFVDRELPNCLSGFAEFKKQGLEVKSDNIKSDVLFAADNVVLNVNYPVEVKSGGKTLRLDIFTRKYDVRIRALHNITNELANRKLLHPEYLDLSYLGSLDVNSTILTDNSGEQVIVFDDPLSILDGRPYRFLVAFG